MRAIDGDALKRKAQKAATESWKMKIKANVETTLNQFIDWIDAAPTIEPEPQWIPVAEKPIEKGLMLVTYNDGDVDLLKQPTAYRRSDIVAWMPIEPWRGEEHGTTL